MSLAFQAIPTDRARKIQAGGVDAYGLVAETMVSDGGGNPCRHCLNDIPEGEEMLVLAYCPFPAPQPYAEIGPIFLCPTPCERSPETDVLPDMLRTRDRFLIRGYTSDHRIQYGTGQIVPVGDVEKVAEKILAHNDVAYIHMRSASNNCYQCRIEGP